MQPSNYDLPPILGEWLSALAQRLRDHNAPTKVSDSRQLVPPATVAKRRAANKVARRSRAVNRQRS